MDSSSLMGAWLSWRRFALAVALVMGCAAAADVLAHGAVQETGTVMETVYRANYRADSGWVDSAAQACSFQNGAYTLSGFGYSVSNATVSGGNCNMTVTATTHCTQNCVSSQSTPIQSQQQAAPGCPTGASRKLDADGFKRCYCSEGQRSNNVSGNPSTPGTSCEPYSCQKKPLGASVVGPFTSREAAYAHFNSNGDRYTCDSAGANRGCTIIERTEMLSESSGGWHAHVNESITGKYCEGRVGLNQTFDALTPQIPPQENTPDNSGKAPTPCKAGEYTGQVNGATVCIKATNTESKSGTTTTEKPDGSKVSTQTTANCNGSACSFTTKTITTAPNGDESTEITEGYQTQDEFCSNHPGDSHCGSGDGQDGDSDVAGFCDDNPDAAMCQKSSWGGSCSASFTCSGDAIQCAMAQDQHRRNCELHDIPAADRALGDQAIAAGLGASAATPGHGRTGDTEVDIGTRFQNAIATNPFGAACPADITVGGVVIGLSAACPSLQLLGYALLAFTWLSGLTWLVSKGA